MIRRSRILTLSAAAILAAAALIAWRSVGTPGSPAAQEAEIALGQSLYDQNCASCHGANLEGQPDWQIPLANGRYPAPPHDETGHTWHHADPLLAQIVRDGTAAVVGNGYESDMPGFGGILTENEITAVLAYIKSTWPARQRAIQNRVTRDSAP